MAVGGVGKLNASYPKYLENTKKRGMFLGMSGGLAALSVSALHFTKHPIAVKNPKLMLAVALVSSALSILGFDGANKAQKELKRYNILDTKI